MAPQLVRSGMRRGIALFGLAFAMAPRLVAVNRPDTATRRFIMQKARRHGTKSRSDRL